MVVNAIPLSTAVFFKPLQVDVLPTKYTIGSPLVQVLLGICSLSINLESSPCTSKEHPPPETEDPTSDVTFSLSVRDNASVAWNVATLIEPPSKKWAFGLTIQPPTTFNANGEISADFSEHFLHTDAGIIVDPVASDDSVSMDIIMPLIIRSGFAFRPNEQIELELSYVFEHWSSLPDPLIVNDLAMPIKLKVGNNESEEIIEGPIEIPSGYQSTHSVRLGGEWQTTPALALRTGVIFETGGIPPQFVSASGMDRDKFGYGLGASYNITPKFSMDVGIFQSFFGKWTVEDSDIKRIAAEVDLSDMSTSLIQDRVVGNGVYESNLFYGGMSGTYRF